MNFKYPVASRIAKQMLHDCTVQRTVMMNNSIATRLCKYSFKKTIVKRVIITLLSSKISITNTTNKLGHLTGIS